MLVMLVLSILLMMLGCTSPTTPTASATPGSAWTHGQSGGVTTSGGNRIPFSQIGISPGQRARDGYTLGWGTDGARTRMGWGQDVY